MRLFKRDLSKMSDESLMGCLQDGDVEAIDNLYNRYSIRLLHYFHRMLNREGERAQEFFQDQIRNAFRTSPEQKLLRIIAD